ncbi:protein kinase [Colletotrichum higginsianum]|nr:protein kinase [Colletotrichum higginsianum]
MAVFMRGARCWASKEIKTGSGDADRSRQLRHTAERLQQRLNQISDEFEMKLDSVRTSMEDMMATTQVPGMTTR